MEIFFLADADHRAGVRTVRRFREHRLIDDRGTIDQPADDAHVRPAQRRVVEDARILGASVEQRFNEIVTIDAECFGAAVDVETVAGFVLHFGNQRHLAPQTGRARDPVALGEHADDLRVRVLRHHARELLAIAFGHPVFRLDAFAGSDARVERGEECRFGACGFVDWLKRRR